MLSWRQIPNAWGVILVLILVLIQVFEYYKYYLTTTPLRCRDHILLVVVVSKALREMLSSALRVLFCITSPSHCVRWQQQGLIWDVHERQPPAPLE